MLAEGLAPVRTASLLLVAAGAAASVWGAIQKGLAPMLVPFYARLVGRDLLSNRHRLALYRAIQSEPLIHLRGLQRATGLGYGTVIYHLRLLRQERFIAAIRAGREERYYVPQRGFSPANLRSLAESASPSRRRLAHTIVTAGGGTQTTLARDLRMSRSRVCRHLARLERAGLVVWAGDGNRRYAPTPLLTAWVQAHGPGPGTPAQAPEAETPVASAAAPAES